MREPLACSPWTPCSCSSPSRSSGPAGASCCCASGFDHERAHARRRRARRMAARLLAVCAAVPGEAVMTANALLQCALYLVVLVALSVPLGAYIARVYQGDARF